jgi:hypothetical protein
MIFRAMGVACLLTCSVSVSGYAVEWGDPVVQFKTKKVSGSFFDKASGELVTVQPGEGVLCAVDIQNIKEHGAGENFEGWNVSVRAFHPKISEDSYIGKGAMKLFWDKTIFQSPFAHDFAYTYHYFHPVYSNPERVAAVFNEDSHSIDITSNGWLFMGDTVRLFLEADGTTVQKVRLIDDYSRDFFDCENSTQH